MTNNTIKIMTYNMHKGFGAGNISFNIHEMRDSITNEFPDLLFVQEILGKHTRKEKRHDTWPDQSQPEFIADGNWPYFSYSKHAKYLTGHHGNAIFSKFVLSDIKHVTLSKFPRSSRGILYSMVFPFGDSRPIHLMCVHFGMLKTNRNSQINNLIELLLSLNKEHGIILAGDFNDWRVEDTTQMEYALNFKEAYKNFTGDYAKTYPAMKPLLKNDRIYYKGVDLIEAKCLDSKIWKGLSDHLPLVATFSLI